MTVATITYQNQSAHTRFADVGVRHIVAKAEPYTRQMPVSHSTLIMAIVDGKFINNIMTKNSIKSNK